MYFYVKRISESNSEHEKYMKRNDKKYFIKIHLQSSWKMINDCLSTVEPECGSSFYFYSPRALENLLSPITQPGIISWIFAQ